MKRTQFHVLRNLDEDNNQEVPYVIDIQSNLLAHLSTRVVIPLIDAHHPLGTPINGLTFKVEVEGFIFSALTQQLSPMTSKDLGQSVLDLSQRSHEIIAAVDYLLSGI